MKQFWIGVGILAALFLAGLWLGDTTEEMHLRQAKDLEKAAAAALEGDWPLAQALTGRAEKEWRSRQGLTAALYRHDPLDLIDAGFASLKGYAACEDTSSFSGVCGQLAQQLRCLPENHRFRWRNLL